MVNFIFTVVSTWFLVFIGRKFHIHWTLLAILTAFYLYICVRSFFFEKNENIK